MRKNKLYTVNKWNRPAFMPEPNLFPLGGQTNSGMGLLNPNINASEFWSRLGVNTTLNNPLQTSGSNTGTAGLLGANAREKGVGLFDKEAWGKGGSGWAVAGAAASALGNINTGERRGMWDTLDPVHHLAGGRESGAGNAMGDAGVALTQAGLSSGQPYLALAGAGLKVLGGLTNAAFGIKTDKERLEAAENSINENKNFLSNATDFDDIQGPAAMTSTNVYKGGWFSGGKARRKNRELQQKMADAAQWAYRSVDNNVDNIKDDQLSDLLANYAAYGGPLGFGTGALGIMQNDKYLDTINNRSMALASKQQITPGLLAFGGELGTNGTDFTNGLLYIDEGGTHESNPFDGVPMGLDAQGIPNLVEEGETIYNDYVFSDRMKVPDFMLKDLGLPKSKKRISFADASKKLAKESEQRPNDPISQAGLDASLSQLAEIQETERMRDQAGEYTGLRQFACGGKMGNLFEGTGNKPNSLKPYAYSKSWDGFKYFDPKTQQYDQGYLDFVNNIGQDWLDRIFSDGQPYGSMNRYLAKNRGYALTPKQASALAQDKMYSDMHKAMAAAYDDYQKGMDPKTGIVPSPQVVTPPEEIGGLNPTTPVVNPQPKPEEPAENPEEELDPRNPQKTKKYATWMRYAPVFGAGALALTDALGLTNKPDYSGVAGLEAAAEASGVAPQVSAEPIGDYMRYTPLDRLFYENQMLASSRATDRTLLNSSSPSKAAGILANGYNTILSMGNLARQAEEYNRGVYERTKEFNRRTNMFNSQMGLEAAMANARYSQQGLSTRLSGLAQAAALRDSIDARTGAAKAANLSNLLTSLGNIGRENFTFNQINSDRSRRYKVRKSGQSYYNNNEFGLGGRIRKCK